MKHNKQNVTKRRQTKRKATHQKKTTRKYKKKNLRKLKKHTKKGGMYHPEGPFSTLGLKPVPNTPAEITPYAIIVVSTHGELRTIPRKGPIGRTEEFKTFELPVNMYKIDATDPGSCYLPPKDGFNHDIKTIINEYARMVKDYYNDTLNRNLTDEPYFRLHDLLPSGLKIWDTEVRGQESEYPYKGTYYTKDTKVHNKVFSFNSSEAQEKNDFAIELYVSDKYGNLQYYNITEEVFNRRNIYDSITPKDFSISLSTLLSKIQTKLIIKALDTLLHQGKISHDTDLDPIIDELKEAYNYIFIDFTCSLFMSRGNEEVSERDVRRLAREARKGYK
jgi:hypothetical protein